MNVTDSDPFRFQSATASKDKHVPTKRYRRIVTKPDTVKPNSNTALLQSAMEVRQNLRDSLVQVNTLIREVKAQRRQDRLLQTTMDSLRKLSLA